MLVAQKLTRVVSIPNQPRSEFRRPVQTPAVLSVLDGALAGSRYPVMTRSSLLGGLSFLLRQALQVGQSCALEITGRRKVCEVVGCRPLSNGKMEIAVAFR